jgi:transcriptional regulator GlxA family with amidase domain
MQSNKQPAIRAVFVIPPKVHLLDITGPAQIFHEAALNDAAVELIFGSIFTGETASVSSSMLSFDRLTPFNQIQLNRCDLIFVPGIDSSLFSDKAFMDASRPFLYWLNVQHKNGVIICSICTGAFFLAESGLLDGRACTTHWGFTERLKKHYPRIRLQTNRLFVEEDGIYTSAGVSSGIDLSLYLVEQLWGAHFAAQIAKEAVIYFRRGLDDPQLSVFTQYRNHLDHRIHQVQDILTQSLDHKFTIDELAEKVNMSARNLTRLFKKTTQITIGAYLDQLRAEHAEKLMAEGHTLLAAALHCGLKSTNQLRHLIGRKQRSKDAAYLS